MGKTEEDIKLESDTFALRRDFKYALQNVETIKRDTAEIIAIRDRVSLQVEAKQEELKDVLNQIAEEKVTWAQYRHGELVEIENKQSAADNVLKRKGELNEQEEVMRQITVKNEELLNEARRIEFKNEQDKTAFEVRDRDLEAKSQNIILEKQRLAKAKEDFKERVIKVLNEVENIC